MTDVERVSDEQLEGWARGHVPIPGVVSQGPALARELLTLRARTAGLRQAIVRAIAEVFDKHGAISNLDASSSSPGARPGVEDDPEGHIISLEAAARALRDAGDVEEAAAVEWAYGQLRGEA